MRSKYDFEREIKKQDGEIIRNRKREQKARWRSSPNQKKRAKTKMAELSVIEKESKKQDGGTLQNIKREPKARWRNTPKLKKRARSIMSIISKCYVSYLERMDIEIYQNDHHIL